MIRKIYLSNKFIVVDMKQTFWQKIRGRADYILNFYNSEFIHKNIRKISFKNHYMTLSDFRKTLPNVPDNIFTDYYKTGNTLIFVADLFNNILNIDNTIVTFSKQDGLDVCCHDVQHVSKDLNALMILQLNVTVFAPNLIRVEKGMNFGISLKCEKVIIRDDDDTHDMDFYNDNRIEVHRLERNALSNNL